MAVVSSRLMPVTKPSRHSMSKMSSSSAGVNVVPVISMTSSSGMIASAKLTKEERMRDTG